MAGHQIWGADKIGQLSKINSTTLELSASIVTLGGLQYDTLPLQIQTFVNGVGGLDTGSIAANTMYYVYLVLNSGDAAIVASVNPTSPTGFSRYIRAGMFSTGNAGAVKSTNGKEPIVKSFTTSGIYNTPVGVKYLKVTAIGGGAGGAGASNNGSNNANYGGAGTDTIFGTALTAYGAAGGGAFGSPRTVGGGRGGDSTFDPSVVTPLLQKQGGFGGASDVLNGAGQRSASHGGSTLIGGGSHDTASGNENSGSGGAGAGTSYTPGGYYVGGGGGGGGGSIVGLISNPESNYSYIIGSGGSGGSGQLANGQSGKDGIIIVEEYYE